jgi:hypothetical protein
MRLTGTTPWGVTTAAASSPFSLTVHKRIEDLLPAMMAGFGC